MGIESMADMLCSEEIGLFKRLVDSLSVLTRDALPMAELSTRDAEDEDDGDEDETDITTREA